MNRPTVLSDAPQTAEGLCPGGAMEKKPPRRAYRRRAMLAVAGLAALLGGAAAYWRTSTAGRSVAGVSVHSSPLELPDLRFTDGAGVPTSVAAFRGRVVLRNVWATWCPPCREEMPTLDRLQQQLGGPDFEVVTLSIDSGGLPVVEAFFRQIGVEHLHPYLDTIHAGAALVGPGIPLTLLIDGEGRERGRKLGPATWDGPQILALIREYLPTAQPHARMKQPALDRKRFSSTMAATSAATAKLPSS